MGGAPWDQPRLPGTPARAAYVLIIAAAALVLYASAQARRRERELTAIAKDAEKDVRSMRATRDATIEAAEGMVGLPTDTLLIVTEQGYLCPNGLDHPAGSHALPDQGDCASCRRYLDAYDK